MMLHRMLGSPVTARVSSSGACDGEVVRAFLDHLQECGLLDAMACDRAAAVQTQTGQRIDDVLSQLGLVTDAALLQSLADFCDLPLIDLVNLPPEPVLPEALKADFLRRNRVVPLQADARQLAVAVADPFARDVLDAIAYHVEMPVVAALSAPRNIDLALSRLYGLSDGEAAAEAAPRDANSAAYEDDIQRLRDMASEAPIIRLVHRLIASAVGQGASDIHVEPAADSVRVRYRIDGVMEEVERLPPDVQTGVATRIKILGNLNIAERRLPQDGRSKFVLGGREIDLRVSTTPILHGESIVLRILDSEQVDLTFDALGFDHPTQAELAALLARPNGIILVTGPTGSGKTTTLYSALTTLNSAERKIFTVEDPIEYQLPGVNQMQIKPLIGLDFVHCLRSILRQDPDVIMIGEMRDAETASTAIRAALTGHLVLSTLHTNSASASVTRLLDMGVEDYLLGSSLSCVLAQRLVRKLCPNCAIPLRDAKLQERLAAELGEAANQQPARLRQSGGCAACKSTGFRGRTTIAELLIIDDNVRTTIKRGTTDRDIEKVGLRNGMRTLYRSGVAKVLAGETTLEEVLRVART
jgi:general secretion pathway protein E